ncbi:alpha/beta hydrolase [Treponema sp.]
MKAYDRKIIISGISTAMTSRDGDGPALVCIHGNSLSRNMFKPLFDSDQLWGRRIISYDLPGHGESAWSKDPASSYTLRGFAMHLVALIGAVNIEKAVILGVSLGGHIAMQALSAGLISRPAGFVTIGSPPIASPSDLSQAFLPLPGGVSLFNEHISEAEARAIVSCISANPKDYEGMLTAILTSDPQSRATLLRDIVNTPFQNEGAFIASSKLPSLLCFGENDQAINLDYFRSQSNSPCMLCGEAHLPDFSRPNGFLSHLSSFLDSIDG